MRRWAAPAGPGAGGARGARAGGAGEISQVLPLGLIELQGAAERLEHALGHPGEIAALELRVVLDADSSQVGDLASPAWPGVALARRELRKALTSLRLSTPPGQAQFPGPGVGLSVHRLAAQTEQDRC